MAIFCFGSINADFFFYVPRFPAPGETLAAHDHLRSLGGKGANQSVAAARAGSDVAHLGAVGSDGAWMVDILADAGVDTKGIAISDSASGQAQIYVDDTGENAIIIYPGANRDQDLPPIQAALSAARPGDLLLLQNETSLQADVAKIGKKAGLKVVYSAAPFDVAAVRAVLPHTDILVMNEIEERQLLEALGTAPPVSRLVTLGADGAVWRPVSGETVSVSAHKVPAVDTTGAGDTFTGYFAAGLDQSMGTADAMRFASAAAAVKVTRKGTASAIPTREDVQKFLNA